MTISILGCGWFGLPLAAELASRGHLVKGSTTTKDKFPKIRVAGAEPFLLDLRQLLHQDSSVIPFFHCDILVVTLPPKAGEDHAGIIQILSEVAKARGIRRIIYTSSISVYGTPDAIVDELSPVAPSMPSSRMIRDAENILRSEPAFEFVCVRFGGLVGPGRSPANFFKDASKIPNGLAPVNLIHLDDCVRITTQLVETPNLNLTVNAVSPHHPTRKTFYTAAALASGKLPPGFIAEKKSWKEVKSRYLEPVFDYRFKVDNWFQWLREAAGQ
ncbi:MAG: hypothetical protein BGO55_29000 [Sphingobacteriales bacterium 50-39]|nr:NAD(P)H-binding protein [Sphingobacteriales bacterium]OJW60590.1 MAG: hypothetical protein BGO55_29000 [Sphingobacteriales bacterium 50-39]